MNTVIIIQARMGSTRLPGKILRPIGGLPMLQCVWDKCSQSVLADEVVLATTDRPADEATAVYAASSGMPCFRGDEKDVLARFHGCADWRGADVIVRVTADCPLIDPGIIDRCIAEFLEQDVDYCSNVMQRTYPRGMDTEVFSRDALERMFADATSAPSREHVTTYIRNEHPELFRIHHVRDEVDRSRFELSVDTPEDVRMVEQLISATGLPVGKIRYTHLCAALAALDGQALVNGGVARKTDHIKT